VLDFFKFLNRFFMVPAFRLGLGPVIGNPISGYIMVIETLGRKTGERRFTPVNYALIDGRVYCLAGFGSKAHWLLNLQAQPNAALILPGRRVYAHAMEVSDSQLRVRAARQVLINGGFAGFFFGFNPRSVDDDRLEQALEDIPVLAFDVENLDRRAGDPGGYLWLLWLLLIAVLIRLS